MDGAVGVDGVVVDDGNGSASEKLFIIRCTVLICREFLIVYCK